MTAQNTSSLGIRDRDLYLHEQMLLLALRDERGTLEWKASMYRLALGGALLAELSLAGCVAIESKKRALVDLVEAKRFGDAVLDECLDLVAGSKRRRRASYWVARFSRLARIRHRVAAGLCRKGVLRDSEERAFLFFRRKVYPTTDPRPEARLIEELRRAMVRSNEQVEPRAAIALAVAQVTGLLKIHFERRELKEHKQRIKSLIEESAVARATRDAVREAQAAAAAAAG